MLVLPDWLLGLRVFALLGLQHLLSSSYSHIAVLHVPEGLGAPLQTRSLEPQMENVGFFLLESGLQHHEASLLPLVVQKAPQGGSLDGWLLR